MKQYNCPDCALQCDSCDGCPRVKNLPSNKTPNNILPSLWEFIPECCQGCSNHPSNGGSGICHCTLPYFNGDYYQVTCGTLTTDDIYGNIVTTVTRSDII